MKAFFFKAAVLMAACISGLTSCGSARYIAKDETAEITSMSLVRPVARISFIDRDGQAANDEALSAECAKMLTETAFNSGLPISDMLDAGEDIFSDDYIDQILSIRGINHRKAGVIAIPKGLDKLLEDNGVRYGVVLCAEGFDRDVKNYRKEAVKGALLGLVTTVASLGAVSIYNVPARSTLNTWIAVLDSQNDRIVYFNHVSNEISPVNMPGMVRQFDKLTKGLNK